MSTPRGRQARLKPEYAGLYPGIETGVWLPVETLLLRVTELIDQDRSRSQTIAGTRLLHQDHFDFRGASVRPEGLPPGATRLSDMDVESGS